MSVSQKRVDWHAHEAHHLSAGHARMRAQVTGERHMSCVRVSAVVETTRRLLVHQAGSISKSCRAHRVRVHGTSGS